MVKTASSSDDGSSQSNNGGKQPSKKRIRKQDKPYARACANCRKKKVRCDGKQPSCTNCTKTYLTQCCYDEPLSYKSSETLLRKYNEASKLLDMLSDNPQLTESITAQWHSIKNANGIISTTSTFQTRDIPLTYGPSTSQNAMETSVDDDKLPFELSQDIIHHLQSIYLTWQWPLHCFVERKQLISTLNEEKVRYTCPLLLFTILAHASRFSSRDASPSFLSMHDLTKMQQFFLSKAKALLYKQIEDKPSSQGVSAILMLASRQVANASFNQAWIFAGIAIRMLQELEIVCFDGTKCTFRPQYFTGETGADRIDARRAWHLYQSCYTFDKTLSFGLGKTPSLQQANGMSNSMESLENSSELDEDLYWPDISQPNDAQSLSDHDRSTIMTTSYSPRAHHPHRTFTAWYRLSVIFGSILATEQTPLKRPLPSEEVKNFAKQLRIWKETLPSCINIPHPEMEEVSPPPNIVTLNVVYHTCTILLYGSDLKPSSYAPTIGSETSIAATLSPSFSPEMLLNVSPSGGDYRKENARMLCTKAAIEIHKLLKLWARTFTFDRMTWLFGCCIYTAAIVDAYDAQSNDSSQALQAAERLNFGLKALMRSAGFTPGIRKSTSAIIELVSRTYTNTATNTGTDTMLPDQHMNHAVDALLSIHSAGKTPSPDKDKPFDPSLSNSSAQDLSTLVNHDKTLDQSFNGYSSSLHQDGFGPQQMNGLHQSNTSEWPDTNHLTGTTATEIPPPTESSLHDEMLLWDAESLLNNVAFLEAFGSLPLQPYYADLNSS